MEQITKIKEEEPIRPEIPSWISSNKYVRFIHQYYPQVDFKPVLTVSKQKRFMKDELMDLMILEPSWPARRSRTSAKNLIFELTENKNNYYKMKEEMSKYYKGIDDSIPFPMENLKPGYHVVFFDKNYDCDEFIYKRAVVLDPVFPIVDIRPGCLEQDRKVSIRLIDEGFELDVFCYNLMFLEGRFAILPARAYRFVLDGMEHYEDLKMHHQLFHPESWLFDGNLFARLRDKKTNSVVLYSQHFKCVDNVYGLNGVAIKRFASQLNEILQVGEEISNGFIVHITDNAEVFIQFETPFMKHYESLLAFCTDKKIRDCKGEVKLSLDETTILMAPRADSNRMYCRCKYLKKVSANMVQVRFIDYGDLATCNVTDVVFAEHIHPGLCVIPELAILVRLSGIKYLNKNSFWEAIPQKTPVVVYTSENQPGSTPVVELRQYCWSIDKLLRTTIVDKKKGKRGAVTKNTECVDHLSLNVQIPKLSQFKTILLEQPFLENQPSNFYNRGRVVHLLISSVSNSSGFVFVYPTVLWKRLKILEEKLKIEYDKPWRRVSSIYIPDMKKGNFFMVNSTRLGLKRVVRCRLMEVPNNDKTEVDVYLVDYGWIETVPSDKINSINDFHCLLPGAGCLAALQFSGIGADFESKEFKNLTNCGEFRGEIVSTGIENRVPKITIEVIEVMNEGIYN